MSTAHWDVDAVRDDLVADVLKQLAVLAALLVLDKRSCVKQGAKTVGVAPQSSGAVGKLANCQIGDSLATATAAGPFLLKAWGEDVERRTEAGAPP